MVEKEEEGAGQVGRASMNDYSPKYMNIEQNISPRSRTVTLILACLLFCACCGGLHRIYTGKIFTGILQILTGGGFLIWQIIDIIRILFGSFDDAQGRDITEW